MIWIHHMPSVAEHGCTESVNGEYSGHFFFNNPYNLLALVEQNFTQQQIFALFFYIEVYVVIIVAKTTIVKATWNVTV